jgi:hypothetical protein
MLSPTFLRELHVPAAAHPRGQPHLSAASGLVRAGRWLYVVADDEHHIAAVDTEAPSAPVELLRLLEGDLPAGKQERKRRKPDLECLALLPPHAGCAHGALLALGSGSTPLRERGFVLPLRDGGAYAGTPRVLNLSALYAPLRTQFADLNIEGAFVAGDALHLLQRANVGQAVNASLRYPLPQWLAWIQGSAQVPVPAIQSLHLGDVDGVPLGLTDGCGLGDGSWLFSAVAEDTQDSYRDGACAAAAIGHVTVAGELTGLQLLAGGPKVEGIALSAAGDLLMVTDADDPAVASQLLTLTLPAAWRPCAPDGGG